MPERVYKRAMPRDPASSRPSGPMPMPARQQVTRSPVAIFLWWLSAAFYAVALVAVFLLGGWWVIRVSVGLGLEGWSAVPALIYACLFGWACRRAGV